jgi:hypothetical protein
MLPLSFFQRRLGLRNGPFASLALLLTGFLFVLATGFTALLFFLEGQ